MGTGRAGRGPGVIGVCKRGGDVVLVPGASGGVGTSAVQLARARGAQVIAVTSALKSAQLLALGATRTLARHNDLVDALGSDSVDVVIDVVGGRHWPSLFDVLRPGGRCAVAGAIGSAQVEIDLRTLYLKGLSVFGCTVLGPQVFAQLIARVEAAQIGSLVALTFPLERIVEAQQAFMAKSHTGKVVLTMDTP